MEALAFPAVIPQRSNLHSELPRRHQHSSDVQNVQDDGQRRQQNATTKQKFGIVRKVC
jgi:hypothetical protein